MRIYDPDYIYSLKTVEKPFKWGAAGDVVCLITNQSTRPFYVHSLTVKNGGTAGTTTPGAFDVKTPNSEYTVTFPANDMVAGETMETVFIGAEPVPAGKTFLVTMKTATTAAKDGTLIFTLQD
jgi:hypothetical protein